MKFRISVREIHGQDYLVEAATAKEAIKLFNHSGEGEPVGSLEYSHIDSIAALTDENGETVERDALELLESEVDAEIDDDEERSNGPTKGKS